MGESYLNPLAKFWRCNTEINPAALEFHQAWPQYNRTRLCPLPDLAKELGVAQILVKEECQRFGLPSFKILGASWAVHRAVAERLGVSHTLALVELREAVKDSGLQLIATTEGNWGRAVARVGKFLGLDTKIHVPEHMDVMTRDLIREESAELIVVNGEYDDCIESVKEVSSKTGALLVMDTAWKGYEQIPRWVTEGYSTMLIEVDQQLQERGSKPATIVIASVGVGSWAHAVVAHYKSKSPPAIVLTVEPDAAPCLNTSLRAGRIVPIKTGSTIMNGMNCGTVSSVAWPFLRDGVDLSLVVQDEETHHALQYCISNDIKAGPCGAATLAALHKVKRQGTLALNQDDVVIIFSTEGPREYIVPLAM